MQCMASSNNLRNLTATALLASAACNATPAPSRNLPLAPAVAGGAPNDAIPDPGPAADSIARAAPSTPGVHIVELFTSQGCSSCPPADAVLAKLAQRDDVVALAFHVDYWNYLGWADPFSSADWTDRQQTYAAVLDHRVYTPQLVVDGRVGMVGSNRLAVDAALAAAPRPAQLAATARWQRNHVELTVTAPANASVWLAFYDRSITTDVMRGENAGATLGTTNPVRQLRRVAQPGQTITTAIPIPDSCQACNAVAFSQPAANDGNGAGAIEAAINLPAPAKPPR